MRSLVVYYSRDGHTKRAAEIIAKIIEGDIDEIIDKKPRKGILGFLRAGYDATLGKTTEIEFKKSPENYDLVVIGSPVWNRRITPAVRTYLLRNSGEIKRCVFFVTCAGRAGKSIQQMRELYKGEVLAEKVIVRKNLEVEARNFGNKLKEINAP